MIRINAKIKNKDTDLIKPLQRAEKRADDIIPMVLRGVGFSSKKTLATEIRKQKPGGKSYDKDKRQISRKLSGKRDLLKFLAKYTHYDRPKEISNTHSISIGWVGSGISKRAKGMAKSHQKGFKTPVSDEIRKKLRRMAEDGDVPKKYRQFFFIRDDTKQFETSARPILEPFFEAHREHMRNRFKEYYTIKYNGGKWPNGQGLV